MNDDQLNELSQCFNSFDTDGSGSISISELKGICEKLDLIVNESDIEQLMAMMDRDGSGQINFQVIQEFKYYKKFRLKFASSVWNTLNKCQEFENTMGDQFFKKPNEEELLAAFNYFDSDNNGFISEEELMIVMSRFRGGVTKDEINRMIKNCDHDNDGKINKKEFLKILLKQDI